MSEPTPDQSLHLPSLVIKNFRGIDELTIPRLARVTQLTGKNGGGEGRRRCWTRCGYTLRAQTPLHSPRYFTTATRLLETQAQTAIGKL